MLPKVLGDLKVKLSGYKPPEGHVPVHEHDCDECVFLKNGKHFDQDVDWWVCTVGESVIARNGINGDYWSYPAYLLLDDLLRIAKNVK